MKVIICGAGQVGFGIAERLSAEGNDVSIIDASPALVARANNVLEVNAIAGNAAHPDVLERAGANDADMLIAVTLHDEVNMVACQVAHTLFDIPTKVARIRAQTYFDEKWSRLFAGDSMGIDHVISPEIEVGQAILRRLELPGAFETASFADDKVTLIGISCRSECPVTATPLKQLTELFPDLPAITVGLVRDGKLFIPHSNDQIEEGDDVYIISPTEQVSRTLKIFGHEEHRPRRIVIAGGGNIGFYLARTIEARDPKIRVRIIESDRDRALEIAELLDRAVVLCGSAISEEILREADITAADTLVAVTNDDQINLLASALAKQLGCKSSLCLVNSAEYSGLIRSLGIDAQIDPRTTTASRILQYVRRGRIRGVYSIRNGAGEVIEAEVLETAPILQQPLRDAPIAEGVRIGAVLRNGVVIKPTGSLELEVKDRVVLLARADYVREVEHMFRVSPDYF